VTIFLCGLVERQKWATAVYLGVRRVPGRLSRATASVASLGVRASLNVRRVPGRLSRP